MLDLVLGVDLLQLELPKNLRKGQIKIRAKHLILIDFFGHLSDFSSNRSYDFRLKQLTRDGCSTASSAG